MSGRTIEDQFRSEYFELLPHIRQVADEVDMEVRYLEEFEAVAATVTSQICGSD